MRAGEKGLEDYKLAQLRQKADQLCEKIKTGIPLSEFLAQEKKLREFSRRLFPEKLSVYDLIYRSRFQRLWEQFRGERIEFEEERD